MGKGSKFLVFLMALLQAAPVWAGPQNRPKTTITKPEIPWVDAPGNWSRGEGDGNGSGAANNLLNGLRNNGQGVIGAGGTNFTKPGAGAGGGGGGSSEQKGNKPGSPGESGSSSSGGGSAQIFDLWWPICAFIDESVDEATGNAALKGQVEMAAACGVNVVFWPKTVKAGSWYDDPGYVNSKQVEKCNLPPGLAKSGSTTSLVPWPLTAAKMCGAKINVNGVEVWDPGVAGCAELASGASEDTLKKNKASGGEGGGGAAKGGVAASIEVPSGHNASTVAHESQGHSQFGKPNGSIHGNGIGEDEEKEGSGGAGGWSASGCAVMRATALPNTRRFAFDPQRQTYYIKPRDPEAYYDIANDPPLFQDSQDFPLAQNGSVTTPPGTTIVMRDDAKVQNPPETKKPEPGKQGATMVDGEEDERHKRKNVVNALLDSLRGEEGSIPGEKLDTVKGEPRRPPAGEPKKPGPRLGFDDSAPKGRAGRGGGEAVTEAEKPPSGEELGGYGGADEGGGDDEPVRGGGGGGAYAQGNGQGGTGAGASLTYDDDAPKGGLAAGGTPVSGATRGPASEGGDAGTLTIVRAGAGLSGGSDWDDDFFDEVGEDGKTKKRRRGKPFRGQRERSRRELREPSAEGRASKNQTYSEDTP